MRSAGCVINDFADREFDPHVERTKSRPIAAGKVAPGAALIGFVLAGFYPFLKRYTHFPQAWLGMLTLVLLGFVALMHGGVWVVSGWALALILQLLLCWRLLCRGKQWGFTFFLDSHWVGALFVLGFIMQGLSGS